MQRPRPPPKCLYLTLILSSDMVDPWSGFGRKRSFKASDTWTTRSRAALGCCLAEAHSYSQSDFHKKSSRFFTKVARHIKFLVPVHHFSRECGKVNFRNLINHLPQVRLRKDR